jgi:hypothetical protein
VDYEKIFEELANSEDLAAAIAITQEQFNAL